MATLLPLLRRRGLPAAACAPVAALALGPPAEAQAQTAEYRARSFTEAARPGLPVAPPLADLRAVAEARVAVPAVWRSLDAAAGQLRFITPGDECRYRLTFRLRSLLGTRGEATAYVAGALVPAGPRYLLDEGTRRSAGFRVVRERSSTGVRLRALHASVLTRRRDIVPAGQVAWAELTVTAAQRRQDECHAGTWRETLGPRIGDVLATARVRLEFLRPGEDDRGAAEVTPRRRARR